MSSGFFEGIEFVLDSSSFTFIPFKKKQELRKQITNNGGIISYILTKKSNFVLTADGEKTLSSYKGNTALKYGVPVVHIDFINQCVGAGMYLDPASHLVSDSFQEKEFSFGKISAAKRVNQSPSKKKQGNRIVQVDLNSLSLWVYKDPEGPHFPEKDYKIAKDMILKKSDASGEITQFFAVELHVVPSIIPCEGPRYRVFTHHGSLVLLKSNDQDSNGQIFKECYYSYTVEEAMGIYVSVHDKVTTHPFCFEKTSSCLSYKIGSDKMKEQRLEVRDSTDGTPPILEVTSLVDYLWNEAVGCLTETLAVPVDSLKLQSVLEAEAVLVSLKECLDKNCEGQELNKLWKEFVQLIPHEDEEVVFEKSLIAEKQNLCQLIRDIITVSESTNMSKVSSQMAKYRALRCHIEYLDEDGDEFERIKDSVLSSLNDRSREFRLLNVFSLHRPVEESNFTHHLDNKKLLYHASRVSNFVGILSRGLLLPKIVVDDLGGKRSDPGMLGSGIYFGSSASTSAKYSSRGFMGSRFMLINEVALGRTKRYRHFCKGLTGAPEGYHSTHGVAETRQEPSDFKDDEFVVYETSQQRMRYLVEFSVDGEYVRKRHVDFALLSNLEEENEENEPEDVQEIDLSDVTSLVDPLSKVHAGLKGSGDQPVPLKAVHIRAKLLDLVAQVVVLQSYKNNSYIPIEAKYVFPLDDMAAVCGFEAFINGKHIIGEVKEKEQARKEYREAISQGHGAYLMDEETPDVFTVSVGNLPPYASVLIKITYVAELAVEGEHISFNLPGSVAPWKRSQALDDVTQTDVDTVRIEEEKNTTIQVAIEMPFDIRSIECPTHPVRIKRTATKAVVELETGHVMGDGFQLIIGLAEIHVPRMWVENHETKHDSEAAMLVFYPEFEAEDPDQVEVLFCVDASCSMKGSNLKEAKKILQMCINYMSDNWLFNIIVFGSYHSELFPNSQTKTPQTINMASDYIKSITAHKGSTDLWRALESLSLIPSMSTADHPRNIFIISDGHVTEEAMTLKFVRQGRLNTRVFTLGVGVTSNRHMLRSLAKVGAGANEFFDSKTKSKWERKVKAHLIKAGQPGLTSVSVTWQQHDSYANPPVQAPYEIFSLFSGTRLVVYGLVSNCTQASLTAEVNGREITTVVSTSDLSITKGKILHQLVARGLIKDWAEGNLNQDHTKHEVAKRETKEHIISLSKEFSIVSQFTSFIAVEKREKDETFDESSGPSIQELVADENVDIIPYVSWEEGRKKMTEQKKTKMTPDDKVLHLLNEAKEIENVSVLQAESLYKKACNLVKDEKQDYSRLISARAFLELSIFYSNVCHDKKKMIAVMEMLRILAEDEDDEQGDSQVIEELTELFGSNTIKSVGEEMSKSPFHPQRSLILEIFPDREYKWSKAALDNYESSTTDETDESSSSESESSSEEEEDRFFLQSRESFIKGLSADSTSDSTSDEQEDFFDLYKDMAEPRDSPMAVDEPEEKIYHCMFGLDSASEEVDSYEDMDFFQDDARDGAFLNVDEPEEKYDHDIFGLDRSSEEVKSFAQMGLFHYDPRDEESKYTSSAGRSYMAPSLQQTHVVDDFYEEMDDTREHTDFSFGVSKAISAAEDFEQDFDEDELNAELEELQQEDLDSELLEVGRKADLSSVTETDHSTLSEWGLHDESESLEGVQLMGKKKKICFSIQDKVAPTTKQPQVKPTGADQQFSARSAALFGKLAEEAEVLTVSDIKEKEKEIRERLQKKIKFLSDNRPRGGFGFGFQGVNSVSTFEAPAPSPPSRKPASHPTAIPLSLNVDIRGAPPPPPPPPPGLGGAPPPPLPQGMKGAPPPPPPPPPGLGGAPPPPLPQGMRGAPFQPPLAVIGGAFPVPSFPSSSKAPVPLPRLAKGTFSFGAPPSPPLLPQGLRDAPPPPLPQDMRGAPLPPPPPPPCVGGAPPPPLPQAMTGSPLPSPLTVFGGASPVPSFPGKAPVPLPRLAKSTFSFVGLPPAPPLDVAVAPPPPSLLATESIPLVQPPPPPVMGSDRSRLVGSPFSISSMDIKPQMAKISTKKEESGLFQSSSTFRLKAATFTPPSLDLGACDLLSSRPEESVSSIGYSALLSDSRVTKDVLPPVSSQSYSPTSPDVPKTEETLENNLPQVPHLPKAVLDLSICKRKKRSYGRLPRRRVKAPDVKEIFKLQDDEGYWSMEDDVFTSVGIDAAKCIAVLQDAGAKSLGEEVFNKIAKFFATVLMLFLLKSRFPNLFSFSLDPFWKTESGGTQEWEEQISKAFHWLQALDKKIPSVCWRLELGSDWERAAYTLNAMCIDSTRYVL